MKKRIPAGNVDYSRVISIPIRDMHEDGRIVFIVDVYGVTANDLATIPGGSRPMHRALERMGLDPIRYNASIWDIPVNTRRSNL